MSRRLEVLGEDEDRDRRMGAADLRGGHEPVVGMSRRHADVDDGDVGDMGATSSMRSLASCAARPTTSCPASPSSDAMPSRSSASSSATTMRRRVGADVSAAGVTSLEVMGASQTNHGPVTDARDLGRIEHAVARIVAETEQPVEVYDATLKAIGEALDWQLGAAWEVDPQDGCLRCVRTWHPGEHASEFEALSAALTLAPGEGLPGRVLVSARAGVDRRRPAGRELPARAGGAAQRAARRLRLPVALAARRRGRDGVLRRRAARARRAAAGHDGHAGQSDRPVRGRPPRRRGGACARITAAGHAGGGARRRGDDGRRRLRDRLESRRRGDLRLYRRARPTGARWPSSSSRPPARGPPPRAGALPGQRPRRRPRPPAGADRDAPRRQRVPGRADHHADRAARRRRPSPATCATSPSA